MRLGHSVLADVAADEGKLHLLILVGDDLESDAGTNSVLVGALLADVSHGVELVFLDQLLLVEVLGLVLLFLQAAHLLSPHVLLLQDGRILALDDHTTSAVILFALLFLRTSSILVRDRAPALPYLVKAGSRAPLSGIVRTLAAAHVAVTHKSPRFHTRAGFALVRMRRHSDLVSGVIGRGDCCQQRGR